MHAKKKKTRTKKRGTKGKIIFDGPLPEGRCADSHEHLRYRIICAHVSTASFSEMTRRLPTWSCCATLVVFTARIPAVPCQISRREGFGVLYCTSVHVTRRHLSVTKTFKLQEKNRKILL